MGPVVLWLNFSSAETTLVLNSKACVNTCLSPFHFLRPSFDRLHWCKRLVQGWTDTPRLEVTKAENHMVCSKQLPTRRLSWWHPSHSGSLTLHYGFLLQCMATAGGRASTNLQDMLIALPWSQTKPYEVHGPRSTWMLEWHQSDRIQKHQAAVQNPWYIREHFGQPHVDFQIFQINMINRKLQTVPSAW